MQDSTTAKRNKPISQEQTKEEHLTFRKLLLFFIPLGFSASLTSLSHVIINGTLARGEQGDILIASYAVAFSVFMMMERPVFLLRQTTSAMVQDRISYKAMFAVTAYVTLGLLVFALIVAYTPIGIWLFSTFFESNEKLLEMIIQAYRVLLIVSVFSAFRCLYQGLIINRLQTKWLTIGMIIRLSVMGIVALFFITTGNVNSAWVGGVIFLTGMAIEYAISHWKGRQLLEQEYPQKKEGHGITKQSQVFRFYRPLLLSGGLAVLIHPAVNAFLGSTVAVTLAIAAFALAMSIQQLVLSFFMYLHQIVLQFYNQHPKNILKWSFYLAIIPGILMSIFCFTPFGYWFLETIMGTSENLSEATIFVLRFMIIRSFLFPWVDFCNGILMLRRQTNVMILSQFVNVSITIILLAILVYLVPAWNGMIGGLAVSIGVLGELLVVAYFSWRYQDRHLQYNRSRKKVTM